MRNLEGGRERGKEREGGREEGREGNTDIKVKTNFKSRQITFFVVSKVFTLTVPEFTT